MGRQLRVTSGSQADISRASRAGDRGGSWVGLSPLECESEASGLQVYRQAPVRGSGPPAGTMTRPKLGVLTGAAVGWGAGCGRQSRRMRQQRDCRNVLEGSQG